MRKRGFTLVEIMIVVAIIALLAAIAIPNLIGARRTANDAAAKANIHTLCVEAETYSAGVGNGAYPIGTDAAGWGTVPAAVSSYCGQTKGGFIYACTFTAGGYTVTATPSTPGTTGTATITGTTGGVITP